MDFLICDAINIKDYAFLGFKVHILGETYTRKKSESQMTRLDHGGSWAQIPSAGGGGGARIFFQVYKFLPEFTLIIYNYHVVVVVLGKKRETYKRWKG